MKLKDISQILRAHWRRSQTGKGFDLAVATSDDIDPASGLVDLRKARRGLLLGKGCDYRYQLETGDTIMAFNGAEDKVAIPGYVEVSDIPAVPALNMCVIKPGDVDPVWLFWRLRKAGKALKAIAVKTENRATWFLRMEKLEELDIQEPHPGEIEKVNAIFSEIMELSRERERIAGEMAAKAEEIGKIFE